ncbi:hypothetical protein ACQ5SO_12980 [Rhodovulum sp. DZ06]|uniref:hypothetical protein n=1 Tax=Rhodovulum sp. DZ06 TaxID=3425126 RepID=UPI003D347C58
MLRTHAVARALGAPRMAAATALAAALALAPLGAPEARADQGEKALIAIGVGAAVLGAAAILGRDDARAAPRRETHRHGHGHDAGHDAGRDAGWRVVPVAGSHGHGRSAAELRRELELLRLQRLHHERILSDDVGGGRRAREHARRSLADILARERELERQERLARSRAAAWERRADRLDRRGDRLDRALDRREGLWERREDRWHRLNDRFERRDERRDDRWDRRTDRREHRGEERHERREERHERRAEVGTRWDR